MHDTLERSLRRQTSWRDRAPGDAQVEDHSVRIDGHPLYATESSVYGTALFVYVRAPMLRKFPRAAASTQPRALSHPARVQGAQSRLGVARGLDRTLKDVY